MREERKKGAEGRRVPVMGLETRRAPHEWKVLKGPRNSPKMERKFDKTTTRKENNTSYNTQCGRSAGNKAQKARKVLKNTTQKIQELVRIPNVSVEALTQTL